MATRASRAKPSPRNPNKNTSTGVIYTPGEGLESGALLDGPGMTLEELEAQNHFADLSLKGIQLQKATIELENFHRENEFQRATWAAKRHIMFTGDVGKATYHQLVLEVAQSAWATNEPLTMVINTPGGAVLPGLGLYDMLRSVVDRGVSLTTVGLGEVASMGAVLLQAGSRRVLAPHTWVLIHEITAGSAGKTSEREDEEKWFKRIQDQLLTILASRSTMSKTAIAKRWKRKDWWLSAEEAIDLGFADEVLARW